MAKNTKFKIGDIISRTTVDHQERLEPIHLLILAEVPDSASWDKLFEVLQLETGYRQEMFLSDYKETNYRIIHKKVA